MDPLYRPFFAHVWAFCWPWLWWNLVRLHAWRQRTGRPAFITVDKYGNITRRLIGDAPRKRALPQWSPRWESPRLQGAMPPSVAETAGRMAALASGHVPDLFRTLSGPLPDTESAARAPP